MIVPVEGVRGSLCPVEPHVRHRKAHSKRRAFLAAYAECGSISTAAKLSGVGRRSHYRWLKADAKYVERFREACAAACDTLEAEARRRAVDGVERPVYYKGQRVDTVKEFSDTLLIFLLKGAMPEKYRERGAGQARGREFGPERVEVVYTDDWNGQRNRAIVQELLNHPDYIDYKRQKALEEAGIGLGPIEID